MPTLTIDAGSLLFNTTQVSANLLPQAKITAEGIVAAYNLMGYDAVGITSKDLAGGADYLQKLAKSSNFVWLSANIINKQSAKPLFPAYTTVKLGAHNAAIIGLTAKEPFSSKLVGPGNDIVPWDAIFPQVLASINEEHDFTVLLTDLPHETCQQIAQKFSTINLIIRATGSSGNYQAELLASSTLLAAVGKQGKYCGIMTVDLQKDAPWATHPGRKIADKKRELGRIEWQIDRYRDRPELKARHNSLLKQAEKTRAEINELQIMLEREQADGGKRSTFVNRFVSIQANLPDDQPVLNVVRQIKRNISELGKNRGGNANARKSHFELYAGWRKCGECHQSQLRTWQNSRHAKAYLTLIEKNQQFNQQCVFCHVTGVTADLAVNALSLPPELQHVGCESCHGAGADHAKNPTGRRTAPVTAKACGMCHVPEHDDDFNFERDINNLHCRSTILPEGKS